MRQEFASESKPKTGSNASVSLTKRTQFNRGAGKSLNIVFSRGLRAARTGGVVAAIPFACHTVRRRQRKNLLPNNPPLGFSLGTVTTTETLSTEATPEHHRGCFNAPRASPSPPTTHTLSPPTTYVPVAPDHTRPVAPDHTHPVAPDHIRPCRPRPHTPCRPRPHTRHPRPSPNIIPREVEESNTREPETPTPLTPGPSASLRVM